MKHLLITGFEPFGGQNVNPSGEAVCLLPDTNGDMALTKLRIPTGFGEAARTVLSAAEDLRPDVILCIGQAGGRSAITPEYVGINLRHARIADNAGQQPQDEPIAPDGPAAYFATVPVRRMVAAAEQAGIPCICSYSAGTFVCNELLYTLLHHFRGTQTQVGFVHVPYLPEQGKPHLPLEEIVRGLTATISVL